MSRNVSLCVLARWAVHNTRRAGLAKHRANTRPPTVYVFPACLRMLVTMPPMPHAYLPTAQRTAATVQSPCGHGSRGRSMRSNCSATIGHSVVSIPSGITRWRVTSESFRSDCFRSELGFSVDDILRHRLHRPSTQLSLKFLNLITQINLTTHQRSQRRTIRLILNTPSHNKPHSPHLGQLVPLLRRLSDRQGFITLSSHNHLPVIPIWKKMPERDRYAGEGEVGCPRDRLAPRVGAKFDGGAGHQSTLVSGSRRPACSRFCFSRANRVWLQYRQMTRVFSIVSLPPNAYGTMWSTSALLGCRLWS